MTSDHTTPRMILSPHNLLLIQFAATALMTGIVWFVQIVHYPLFESIPAEGFTRYEQTHTVRTGLVVAPLMILELAAALALPLLGSPIAFNHLYVAASGSLAIIWTSTFLIQVPLHGLLEKRHDKVSIRRLVTTNWIRTLFWSFRLGLLGILLLSYGER
jgi:hypothetical protein